MPDTGFPAQDAKTDFSRARRRQALSRLARRLRREPDDVGLILPFDEVVDALGRRGERRLGLHSISLDSIVGTVDRSRDFDRRFRPTSPAGCAVVGRGSRRRCAGASRCPRSTSTVVDRLEADHARVSDLLDVVEAAARELTETNGGDARRRVIDGLRDLHVHLLEHLDYEERSAGPTMRRLEHLARR